MSHVMSSVSRFASVRPPDTIIDDGQNHSVSASNLQSDDGSTRASVFCGVDKTLPCYTYKGISQRHPDSPGRDNARFGYIEMNRQGKRLLDFADYGHQLIGKVFRPYRRALVYQSAQSLVTLSKEQTCAADLAGYSRVGVGRENAVKNHLHSEQDLRHVIVKIIGYALTLVSAG